jgi:hypothetical protein
MSLDFRHPHKISRIRFNQPELRTNIIYKSFEHHSALCPGLILAPMFPGECQIDGQPTLDCYANVPEISSYSASYYTYLPNEHY